MRFNFYRSFHNIQFEIPYIPLPTQLSVSVCLLCVPLRGQSVITRPKKNLYKKKLGNNLPDLEYFPKIIDF